MARHQLTDEQKRIAAGQPRLVFVESVPGSGKTTVAAERFGVLRHSRHGPDPRGVIAVSFARSAVSELRTRVSTRWGVRTIARPNTVTTMDGLHRSVVEFLLRTGQVSWTGGVTTPELIDSWVRQRGATRIHPKSARNQRWEVTISDGNVVITYEAVDRSCWGMQYAKKVDYLDFLKTGVCTHDEIRQLVAAALADDGLRHAIDAYLARSVVHLIVDEAFDLNDLDTQLVRRVIESQCGVTLIGDPWQALYEWRGARPDLVHNLLADYAFETLPMSTSFRFKTPETKSLAADLRLGQAVTLPTLDQPVDVVLALEWDHLQLSGGHVIPLSFGQLDCQTDASMTLLLDEVTRARLGKRALNLTEALRCLRLGDETPDLDATLVMLRDPGVPLDKAMTALRAATKIGGKRVPALPAARKADRGRRLALLREWLTIDRPYVQGLSVHQAKGCEWPHVGVFLEPKACDILLSGLDDTNEDHRKLYVALTRASQRTLLQLL